MNTLVPERSVPDTYTCADPFERRKTPREIIERAFPVDKDLQNKLVQSIRAMQSVKGVI